MSVALGQFYFGDLHRKWVSFQSALTHWLVLHNIGAPSVSTPFTSRADTLFQGEKHLGRSMKNENEIGADAERQEEEALPHGERAVYRYSSRKRRRNSLTAPSSSYRAPISTMHPK